ncbi:MAG: galactose mutarotase [Actinomycetota bacterium]|nr:galactose mutarotase [Actinomycetota bacterium]
MIEKTTSALGNHDVEVITISTGAGTAVLTNLGARLLELHLPDRNGKLADIVLQRPSLADLVDDDTYMGSTAGRCANRIRGGELRIDGTDHQLSLNEGSHHLHGGTHGFDQQIWADTSDGADDEVTFSRVSPGGEEGYPGVLTTDVTYRFDGASLSIQIRATTDASTVVNIVNHSYFNLAGHESGDVLGHLLQVHGSYYTPVDAELLPTGEIRAVAGTPYDFREPTAIGARIHDVVNAAAGRVSSGDVGYDHNWVLAGTGMREVVRVSDPGSGRTMTLSADQPGVQIYTGGYLADVSAKAPAGKYAAFAGFTLETQTFPDAVHHSHFPQRVLHPGETYLHRMRFDFTTA